MTYACPAFIDIAKTHINRLQMIQNKALRMIMDRTRFERTADIHLEAKVPLINDYIEKLTRKFIENQQQH